MKCRVEERRDHRKEAEASQNRIRELEEELKRLGDGDFVSRFVPGCPPEIHQAGLEDVLAFESVETGVSLFDGLQVHGMELPHPATLNEYQSIKKIEEIMRELLELRILLIGFEQMSPRQFYRTLWYETLWEGCYIQRKCGGSYTIIDVSHSIPRSEIIKYMEERMRASAIQ
jgi:hypothetical protein